MDEGTQLQVFRDLGSMDARIGNLEKDMGEVKAGVATLLERSAVAKGGRSALWTVGGGSATVGGLIVAVAQWLGLSPQSPQERVPQAPTFVQPREPAIDNSSDRGGIPPHREHP